MSYLYVPRVRVQSANAYATAWVINTTPVFALVMFGHNLGRRIGAYPKGIAIIHHEAQLLGEREGKGFYGRLHPQQRRGAMLIDAQDHIGKSPNSYRPLSLQPTASCHLSLSLVFSFESGIDLDGVKDFMLSGRIAGGQIIGFSEPEVIPNETALRERFRSGYWIIERPDIMQCHADPLDAVIKTIGSKGGKGEEGQLPNSWIVPAVLGYTTITDIEQRGGARGGYPHAYCESLVGLVQYVSLRDFGERALPFWHHKWIGEDVFVIQQEREKQS